MRARRPAPLGPSGVASLGLGWPLVLLLACTAPQVRPAGGAPVTVALFVSAGLRGSLAPCGCSQMMLGGLAHAAAQVDRARGEADAVFYLDGGDALFGAAAIAEPAVAQQERKARALAEALTRMGLSALARGPLDDARGAAFRAALGLPELAEGEVRALDAKGERLAVFAAADGAQLAALGKKARAGGARFVVALLARPYEEALKLALAEGLPVDLIVATRPGDELAADANRLGGGAVKVVQVQARGKSLLRVDLVLREAPFEWRRGAGERDKELALLGERVELLRAQVREPMLDARLLALRTAKLEEIIARRETQAAAPLPAPADKATGSARLVALEPTFPEAPAVKAIVDAYDRDVDQLNLAWAREHGKACESPSATLPGVVGNRACHRCHADAFAAWEKTKHSRSYASLERVGKQHHLDCIGCHVTGWQQPGGVCRVDQVAEREVVGCESCHGPGSAHVDDPEANRVSRADARQACVGCHDQENSPAFAFDTFVARVLGPGHGQPK